MTMPLVHLGYLVASVLLTIWVAITLKRHGHVFIARHYRETPDLAVAWSDLLTIGFYLVHVGCLLLALRYGGRAEDATGAIEVLSSKLGLVLIVLGVSHFLHFAAFSKLNNARGPTDAGRGPKGTGTTSSTEWVPAELAEKS